MSYPKQKRVQDESALEETREKPCAVCATSPSDPHHIRTRGAGGGDSAENLIALCRMHHTEIHQIGQTSFLIKYPHVRLKRRLRSETN